MPVILVVTVAQLCMCVISSGDGLKHPSLGVFEGNICQIR